MGKRPFVDRSHIWDDPELLHQATGRQPWEQNPMPRRQPDTQYVEEPATDIASEDEDFAPDVGPDAAGEEFVQTLLELHFAGKLAAKTLCILCYWAEKAGVAAAKNYAFRPGAPSGHFQRHLDGVLGTDLEHGYDLPLPSHSKYDVSRTLNTNLVLCPHECLQSEMQGVPAGEVQKKLRAAAWPETYWEHELVKDAEALGAPLPVPLAFYVDGVPYGKNTSFIGFWMLNLVTTTRHLVAMLRKMDMCRCGCRGWCTIYPVLLFLSWSWATMTRGVWPAARHDESPWLQSDSLRASQAGQPLCFKAFVLFIKGDWSEFATTLGFVSWSSALSPCMYCAASREDRFNFANVNVLGSGWPETGGEEYEQACLDAELARVIASAADRDALTAALRYDKRKKGAHGRALIADIPHLGLLRGDRLDPCPTMPDVGALDTRTDFPFTVTLWRPSLQTRTKHRCPLFSAATGVGPDALGVDVLHTVHTGVVHSFVSCVIWLLLSANIWRFPGNLEEVEQLGALRFRSLLFGYYDRWDSLHAPRRASRLHDFTLAMLGPKNQPKLHARAMETLYLFFFSLWNFWRRTRTQCPTASIILSQDGHCGGTWYS